MSNSDATLNDYLDLIRLRILDHVAAFRRRVEEIDAMFAKRGANGGSNHFLTLADDLRRAFRSAAVDILKALPEVTRVGGLDRKELIDLTGPRLVEMLSTMISITRLEQRTSAMTNPEFKNAIQSPIEECRTVLPVLMRQAQIGFDRIWDDKGNAVTNTINAGQIVGPVQQGTSHSTQHSSIAMDSLAITEAIKAAEERLADPTNDANTVASLRADIATINAQLAKQSPSRAILNEVGKTMRNVLEGITGGMLTPGAVHAITALTSML